MELIDEPVGCWFLPMRAGPVLLFGIIDSGARYSLISESTFNAIPAKCKSPLKPVNLHLVNADGHTLNIGGRSSISLTVGSRKLEVELIVAETLGDLQIVLGIDILAACEMTLDTAHGILTWRDFDYVLCQKSEAVNNVVLVEKRYTLAPHSEEWVEGTVCGVWNSENKQALISSIHGLAGERLVPYEAVVSVTSDRKLEFLIVNDNDEDLSILPKSPVAEIAALDESSYVGTGSSHHERSTPPKPEVISMIGDEPAPGSKPRTGSSEDIELPEHLSSLYSESIEGCDDKFKAEFKAFLWEHRTAFCAPGDPPGEVKGYEYIARLKPGYPPPKQPVRRFGAAMREIVEKEAERYLDWKIWEECRTSMAENPIILIKKPNTDPAQYRVVSDLRIYNQSIQPLWNQRRVKPYQDLIDTASGYKYYATLDLKHGFFNIPIKDQETKNLLAFSLPSGRKLTYSRLPQGAADSPSFLEHALADVLHMYNWKTLLIYLDDVILFENDRSALMKNLQDAIRALAQAGFKLHPQKCRFNRTQIKYLGQILSAEGTRPNPQLVEAIKKWSEPRDVKGVQSFLGASGYYRRYIPSYSEKALALTKLLKKNEPWTWESPQQEAFEVLKKCLMSEPVLAPIPVCLENTRLFLDCDASNYAAGAVLGVETPHGEKPCAYFSAKLNPSQIHYCTTYKELLSIVLALKHFRQYVLAREKAIQIRTDHRALTWLLAYKSISDCSILCRWLSIISEYNYVCTWRSGGSHKNADSLSRPTYPKKRRLCVRDDCPDCHPAKAPDAPEECRGQDGSQTNTIQGGCEEHPGSSSSEEGNQSDDDWYHIETCFEEKPEDSPGSMTEGKSDGPIPVERGEVLSVQSAGESQIDDDEPPELIRSNWTEQYTLEQLRQFQEDDEDLSMVKGWKVAGLTAPPGKDELLIESDTVRLLAAQFNLLELNKDILYRVIPDRVLPESKTQTQYIVPATLRTKILEDIHCKAGHWGSGKCIQNLKEQFYWPGMTSDVRDFIAGCIHCGRAKGMKRQYTKLKPFPSGVFNHKIHIDIWKGSVPGRITVPGQDEPERFQYVLGIICGFSKLVKLVNMKTKCAKECADCLVENWLLVYGFPRQLTSDRDPSFMGELFQQLCAAVQISHKPTVSYHPNGNGQIEVVFRSLGRFLKTMIADQMEEWPRMTRFCEFYLNSSVNGSTNLTPYQIVYGSNARGPSDLLWPPSPRIKVPRPLCTTGYTLWFQTQLQKTQQFARKSLKNAAIRMKRQYDAGYVKPPEVGTYCYRYIPPFTKGVCKFVGPGKVMEKVSDIHILWKASPSAPTIRLNMKNVKIYSSKRPPANWNEEDPPSPTSRREPSEPEETAVPGLEDSSDSEDQDDLLDPMTEEAVDALPIRRSGRRTKPPARLDL